MAEITIHSLEDIDKAFEEMLNHKWFKQAEADRLERKAIREKAMEEAGELAKGKETVVNKALRREIANDLHHTRIVPLTLMEAIVYSGQARIATHKETRELSRT
jgi:phosphoribosyl-ATP pyrophosphohydrolase